MTVNDDDGAAFREHVLADLHSIAQQVSAMHEDWLRFRPVLAMLAPNSGATDMQRAGVLRALRRAGRATAPQNGGPPHDPATPATG